MSDTIYIINGPNLNLLGQREPHIYGSQTLDDVKANCEQIAQSIDLKIVFLQSNHEGEIIEWIHEARQNAKGIIINAAAFTHTSVAIHDALKAFEGAIIEVHISNPSKREEFRHQSYIAPTANAIVAGFGVKSYEIALNGIKQFVK